ncbi:MAG TPA: ribokinase [Bryobacteraceae bacterium]|jgi:ribokinase|nr:ribokinase [Bryobacteraceae bacterium]
MTSSITPAIVVIGSLNMDFVIAVDRLPLPGETILGRNFRTIPGGKGANQAFAAAKLALNGTAVRMLGRVGTDSFGSALKANLERAGVDIRAVLETDSEATGVACIHVDDAGQNSITVAPGANGVLSPADIDSANWALAGARCVLLQLEVPIETVAKGLREARRVGATCILDPAPARALPAEILELVDIATPNENEACVLAGVPTSGAGVPLGRVNAADAVALGNRIRELGARAVVVKLGDQGSVYCGPGRTFATPPFPVRAVDSTAAGDTFNAALAVSLAEGAELEHALRFANAAAAISVTRAGAQTSAPARAEVESLLAQMGGPVR